MNDCVLPAPCDCFDCLMSKLPPKRLSDDPAVRLAQCRGKPVPPAGDVELLAVVVLENFDDRRASFLNPKAVAEGTQLVDRAHVTRLTAERDALKSELESYKQGAKAEAYAGDEARREAARLQSELTKARECIAEFEAESFECLYNAVVDERDDLLKLLQRVIDSGCVSYEGREMLSQLEADICAALTHQSAQVCEHEWVDARNPVVTSGEICAKMCGAIRSGNQSAPAAKGEKDPRCCCPPPGFSGLWAAGPCPTHMGFGAAVRQVKP